MASLILMTDSPCLFSPSSSSCTKQKINLFSLIIDERRSSAVVSAPDCFKVGVTGFESWLAPCRDFFFAVNSNEDKRTPRPILRIIVDSHEGLRIM
jgi:hypothetical protein